PYSTTAAASQRSTLNAQAKSPAEAAQSAAQLMQQNGGSLLRATLAQQPDPAQAPLSGISYFSVPPPEPKVLKKHDLVTIIVREESEFKSNGTTDLKRQSDLDAKIEQFVRINLAQMALQQSIGQSIPEIK